jgi:SAM-dependent methyltransferase
VRVREGSAAFIAGDDSPFQRYKRDRFLERFLRPVGWVGKRALEIGCGPGGNLLEIARQSPSLTVGVDVAPGMIELARVNTANAPRIEVYRIDGYSLPFESQSFDVAFTATVLQHNDDATVGSLLAEMCRVARERVILIEDMAGRRWDISPSYHIRQPREYIEVCSRAGFALERTERLNLFLSECVYYILNSRLTPLPVRNTRAEGDKVGSWPRHFEALALRVTAAVDARVPARIGLTKCTFRRSYSQ